MPVRTERAKSWSGLLGQYERRNVGPEGKAVERSKLRSLALLRGLLGTVRRARKRGSRGGVWKQGGKWVFTGKREPAA